MKMMVQACRFGAAGGSSQLQEGNQGSSRVALPPAQRVHMV